MEETMKLLYPESSHKRAVRDVLMFNNKKKILITLAGPSPKISYKESKKKGFEKIYSYEINKDVYSHQTNTLGNKRDVKLFFKDIIHAPLRKGAFYDLDFCGNITSYGEHLKKFKDQDFLITVTLRSEGMKQEEVLKFFMNKLGHKRFTYKATKNNGFILSSGNKTYIAMKYRDGSPMMSITKIN